MKKVKMTTKILAIILLCLISFVGIYAQEKNQIKNQIKEYTLGTDLEGSRVLTLNVNSETKTVYHDLNGNEISDPTSDTTKTADDYTSETVKINKDEDINKDNIAKAKKILDERLKLYGVEEYNVRADYTTGNIIVELTENTGTDTVVSNITQTGEFKVVDSSDNSLLMTNDDIKSAKVLYNTTQSGTVVYLNIEFTKDGTKKLEEISKKYVVSTSTDANTTNTTNTTNTVTDTNATSENTNTTNTTSADGTTATTAETSKKVKMTIDGTTMVETAFDTPITDGKLQMSMGSATTDTTTLQKNLQSASSIAYTLDTGKLPIVYEAANNQYVYADNNIDFNKIAIALGCVFVLLTLVLVIIFRLNGLVGAISYIGLAAIMMLIIRYANVMLTVESVTALGMIAVINLILLISILKELKKYVKTTIEKGQVSKIINENCKKLYLTLIPTIILTISLAFAASLKIYSFGFMMFWGLILIALYNLFVTKNLLKLKMVK